jgi:anti-repressor protein
VTTLLAEVFLYETGPIRSVLVDGEKWLVGKDVCLAIGVTNHHRLLRKLDEPEERVSQFVDTPGGRQEMILVNEPGLYELGRISQSPKVRPFWRWVTREVLPTLRATGSYSLNVSGSAIGNLLDLGTPEGRRAMALMVLHEADRADRAEAAVARQGQILATTAPKAQAWDFLATADGDWSVGDAAKVLSRNPGISIGRVRLFRHMEEIGWIYRGRGNGRYQAYQTQISNGRLAELAVTYRHPRTGDQVLDAPQIRVTLKGLEELHRQLVPGLIISPGHHQAGTAEQLASV